MPKNPTPDVRLLGVAQVAEILGLPVAEVMDLVLEGQLRGMRVGSPTRWRIDEASVADYLDAQVELTRRMALWRQSSEASFPELWGPGAVLRAD